MKMSKTNYKVINIKSHTLKKPKRQNAKSQEVQELRN